MCKCNRGWVGIEKEVAPNTVPVFEAQRGKPSFLNKDEESIGSIAQESQVLLQAALDYAARGIPVFPCAHSGKNAKRPLVKNGFKDATTDADQIRAWWAQWPDAMIGMPTGQASGLWVLDIDAAKAPEDENGFASYLTLINSSWPKPADHASQHTPSGGQHIFFKYTTPIRNSAGKVGARIDVRGDGGYVIMAPSIIHGVGAYAAAPGFLDAVPEAPAWLVSLAVDSKKESPRKASQPMRSGGSQYGLKALEDECAILAATPHGQQNETLNQCAFRIGQLVGGGQLERETAHSGLFSAIQGWDRLDLRKSSDTINRALDAGVKEPRSPEPKSAPSGASPSEAPKASKPLPTEDSLAALFTTRYQGKFLFCHETGSWFHWDGVHWQKDRTRYPLHLMRELCREMNQDEGRQNFKKISTRSVINHAPCSVF